MDASICLYSLSGEILTYCGDDNNIKNDIDLIQLDRFISSCFAFSKCNRIETCIDELSIYAISGSMTHLVLISKSNLSSEYEIICNILLYCFEIAYESELKQMNSEQLQMIDMKSQNYTVHDIDKHNQDNMIIDQHSTFTSFQYLIRKSIKSININDKVMDIIHNVKLCDVAIFLFDADESLIFECSDHIIPNQIKHFISMYDGYNKLLTFKAWNGLWSIYSCHVKLWCNAKLSFVQRKNGDRGIVSAMNAMNNLKDFFESLVIGHNAKEILKFIQKLKNDAMIKPKPPCTNRVNGQRDREIGSRRSRYQKLILEQQQDRIQTPELSECDEKDEEEGLNVLIIPSVPIDSIKAL